MIEGFYVYNMTKRNSIVFLIFKIRYENFSKNSKYANYKALKIKTFMHYIDFIKITSQQLKIAQVHYQVIKQ